jgi:hypothetical protein
VKFKSITGVGFKGINTDLAPWELPFEFFTDGRNFRIDGNRIVSSGAHRTMSTPPADPNAGHLRFVHGNTGDFFLVLGSGAGAGKCASWDGSTWNDISSAAGAYAGITVPEDWTSAMLGKIPVVNHPQHYPEYWDPQAATTLLQPLNFDLTPTTFAAAGIQFKVLRAYQNYLFALNLIEGGTAQPNAYRWSHPAPVNNLPPSWDESDDAYIAGKGQIGGETGSIIDGRTLRESFGIYSEFGVTMLDQSFDEFIWKPRPLSESYGVLNDKVLQEVKGVHFFLSDGDILMNDGNTIESIVDDVILKRLRSRMNASAFLRSFSVRDTGNKELWFFIPEGSAEYPDTAYIYNWSEGKWSIQDVPYVEDGSGNPTNYAIHAAYGIKPVEQLTWAMFDPVTGTEPYKGMTWLDSGLTWAGNTQSPLNLQVIGLNGNNGALVELDPVTATAEDTNFQVERTDLTLEGHENICTVTRLYPYMEGSDDVLIEFGSQDFAGGPITWKTSDVYSPNSQRKIDILCTGALFAYRISSIGSGSVSMSGMSVEYELDGLR